jgi:hypothetical protein
MRTTSLAYQVAYVTGIYLTLAFCSVRYCWLVLIKIIIRSQIIVKLPFIKFHKRSSAVLELFHEYTHTHARARTHTETEGRDGAILTDAPQEWERAYKDVKKKQQTIRFVLPTSSMQTKNAPSHSKSGGNRFVKMVWVIENMNCGILGCNAVVL